MMARIEYAHGPELPWGWWLRTVSDFGRTTFVDEDGSHWHTVRDCFWQKRLGMSGANPGVMNEQLELMLAVLAAKDRRVVQIRENNHELFQSPLFQRFYFYWLQSAGLIEGGLRDEPLDASPNDEGVAVIRMLAATRPLELAGIPIGAAAVKMFGAPGSSDECDRGKFEAAERRARRLPFGFVRERLSGKPTIALLYRDMDAQMPMIRTIWTLPFADGESRDRIYGWMHERLDMWSRWGEIALRQGALALTQHLLSLIALMEEQAGMPMPAAAPLAIAYKP